MGGIDYVGGIGGSNRRLAEAPRITTRLSIDGMMSAREGAEASDVAAGIPLRESDCDALAARGPCAAAAWHNQIRAQSTGAESRFLRAPSAGALQMSPSVPHSRHGNGFGRVCSRGRGLVATGLTTSSLSPRHDMSGSHQQQFHETPVRMSSARTASSLGSGGMVACVPFAAPADCAYSHAGSASSSCIASAANMASRSRQPGDKVSGRSRPKSMGWRGSAWAFREQQRQNEQRRVPHSGTAGIACVSAHPEAPGITCPHGNVRVARSSSPVVLSRTAAMESHCLSGRVHY